MISQIDCFLPCASIEAVSSTLEQLRECRAVKHINLLVSEELAETTSVPEGCTMIVVDSMQSSETLASIVDNLHCPYAMLYTKSSP